MNKIGLLGLSRCVNISWLIDTFVRCCDVLWLR